MTKYRIAFAVLLLAIAVSAIVLAGLHAVRPSLDPRDEAVNNQILFNTAHGRTGFSTVKGDAFFHRHFRPIFLPLALPYVAAKGPAAYYFTSALVLALGAIFAFLLAHKLFENDLAALLAGLAWLAFTPMHELALNNFDPESIAATFWLGAFYFFYTRRLARFWVLAMLGVFCKETHAPILAAFGVLALIDRRGWRWFLPPILVGSVWFVVTVKWIIPSYTPEFRLVFNRFAGVDSPDFWGDITRSIAADPVGWLGDVFRWEDGRLLGTLLLATLGLALLGPLALLPTGTIVLQILLHKDALPVRQAHMIAGVAPFFFAAMLVGIKRLTTWLPKFKPLPAALLAAVIVWNLFAAFQPGPFGTTLYQRAAGPAIPGKEDMLLAKVPDDAAVAANAIFLLPLSNRAVLREFDGAGGGVDQLGQIDWIALTAIEPECGSCTYAKLKPESLRTLAGRLRDGHFVVAEIWDFSLLLRRHNRGEAAGLPAARAAAASLLEDWARMKEREAVTQ
jgi:uncharacterized membrane protein